ncbi:MAG TPA: hypothetical protein PKC67_12525 [Kiritimatiellia bacterium]|nr:hypothetical protein [Kiritimatiellia bacterium]HMP35162.1 hypothetical protein [Kiritimatiellia bacterium]
MKESTKHLKNVVVIAEDESGHRQPQTFQMCGLGLQFYSNRRIPEFDVMELDLVVDDNPAHPENVHCTGAVVRCQEVNDPAGRYRVWLKFIDTPETTCSHITCLARRGKHLCTFCENF